MICPTMEPREIIITRLKKKKKSRTLQKKKNNIKNIKAQVVQEKSI